MLAYDDLQFAMIRRLYSNHTSFVFWSPKEKQDFKQNRLKKNIHVVFFLSIQIFDFLMLVKFFKFSDFRMNKNL